jgi:hypothetical protein
VNLGVLVLIGAIFTLPLSLIVVVLMASLVKPTWSFNVLLLLDAAWSFSVLSHTVLVLMAALLKLPLSLIGKFDDELIMNAPTDEMAEPMFEDPDKDDDVELYNTVPGPDSFQNAELFLPHGDRTEIAKVLGRKRNSDGNYIGRKHSNPILDTRIFVVEFPDGETQDIAFNVLAEQLWSFGHMHDTTVVLLEIPDLSLRFVLQWRIRFCKPLVH